MNKAQCTNCKDIIESRHTHDFVSCTCFKETQNLTAKFIDKLNEWIEEGIELTPHLAACAFNEVAGHGFFLDGGREYQRAGGRFSDMKYIEEEDEHEVIE